MGVLTLVNGAMNTKNSTRASIILVTYNGKAYLDQCLDSVHQDMSPDDEVIVVDNASTDGSADMVQREWPEVELIRNETNCGFAAACNQGANSATGGYLVFLNQDTRVSPGWLSALLDALEADPSVALATSKLLLMSKPGRIQACGKDVHYSGMGYSRGLLSSADRFCEAESVGAVDGASFAARRDAWTSLGGFDEEFYMYHEEADLSWRAQLARYKCVYVPTSIVHHDLPLGKPSGFGLYYSNRNRYLMLLKNWSWPTLLLLWPGILLVELATWGIVIQVGWPAVQAKLRAWGWLVRNRARIMELRQDSQAIRQVPDWVILRSRQWKIRPGLYTGGGAGQALTRLVNVLLSANAWLALQLCCRFGW